MDMNSKCTIKYWQTKYRYTSKGLPTMRQISFISEMQEWFNMRKSINVNHINRLQDKNHMIISIGAEKAFGKIRHTFMIKILENVGPLGTCLHTIKAMYKKPTVTILLNEEKIEAIQLKLMAIIAFLLNIMLEALPNK